MDACDTPQKRDPQGEEASPNITEKDLLESHD